MQNELKILVPGKTEPVYVPANKRNIQNHLHGNSLRPDDKKHTIIEVQRDNDGNETVIKTHTENKGVSHQATILSQAEEIKRLQALLISQNTGKPATTGDETGDEAGKTDSGAKPGKESKTATAPDKYKDLNVNALKKEIKNRGVEPQGTTKPELVAQLKAIDAATAVKA